MSDKCIVSFADGAGMYAKGLMRLEQSLRSVKFNGEFYGINDYGHIESPHHKGSANAVPYAFKAHSISKALQRGFRYILWCDSVVYATKSLDPIFNHIKEHGYLLFNNIGYTIGDYTSDACLYKHGMTREEAFGSKMIMACVMGFDTHNQKSLGFLKKYIDAASDGVSFEGDWFNNNLQVSNDIRCFGHRHDQSVASILAKQLDMEITEAQQTYFAYVSHKGFVPISENVGLWSHGIL